MLTLGACTFVRIGSTIIRKTAVVSVSIGVTAGSNFCVTAIYAGIAVKAVTFLTGAAICTAIGTGNRLCVFLVCFLNIRRFQIVRTGMFTVSTSNRTGCCIRAAAPS